MAVVLAGLMTGLMLLVAVGIFGMDAPNAGLLWLLAWLCSVSVAEGTIVLLAVLGASIGQLLAMLIFVYIGLASSGGTVPCRRYLASCGGWLRSNHCGRSSPEPARSSTSTRRPTQG